VIPKAHRWAYEAVADPVYPPSEELQRKAQRLLDADRSSRKRRAEKAKPRFDAKEARKKERAERTAAIRREVFRRDGGKCVVCGGPATDMHHLAYGSGVRRVLEMVGTCVSLCATCHVRAHEQWISVLDPLAMWARREGLTFAESLIIARAERGSSRPKEGP
jgi:5-methylcytosine-specific restriction endonuclease McrA